MSLISRLTNLFRGASVGREIDAELKAHIEMRIEDNITAGMSPEAARRDALLRFGNAAVLRERASDADTSPLLAGIGRDVHYALRQMRHSPGFALTAILTLALGIGANVVVLSVINTLILHPFKFPGADRLYAIAQKEPGADNQSYLDYFDYRARNTTFTDMCAYDLEDAALRVGGTARRVWEYEVSGNYFDMLGIRPALGRFFHPSDEHGPNSAPYIVLSDAFWRSLFHADPHVIGKTVDVNAHPFTVIGIAPPDFHGTESVLWADFWIPLVNQQQIEGQDVLHNRSTRFLWALGQLKPGVTLEQATENLNNIAGQLAKQYPAFDDGMRARLIKPGLWGDLLGDATRAFMFGILVLAFLVLLAACANLASIFAARATDRSRELAIRLAIGSSRWHILRQLFIEALLVSLAGGLVGTVFASLLLRVLTRWQPFPDFPIHITVTADLRIFAVAVLLSIASGVLFGLLPARQIWRTDAVRVMRGSAPPVLFRRFTLRDLLLAVQIAICTLLVTASLVALRGMQRSLDAPLGFQPQGVMLAATDMQMAGYTAEASLAVKKHMLEEAARIPGVTASGITDAIPLRQEGNSQTVWKQDTVDFRISHGALDANLFSVSPGYLKAAGTRLLAGRAFTWNDDAKAPKVALVNEIFARRMFGNSAALGRHFFTGQESHHLYEIVGIVENGKYDSLTEDPEPSMFLSVAQQPESETTLVARSSLPQVETAAALNRMLTGIDPRLVFSIRSWPSALSLVLFPARIAAAALGVMGLLAAMLAITGIFGMAAYSVSKRMRELGIRAALGAHRTQLMRSALGRPIVLLASGSAVGLLLGMLTSRLLAQIVYLATSRDPLVLATVIAAMMLIGLLATWIPARHALTINPARLLREE